MNTSQLGNTGEVRFDTELNDLLNLSFTQKDGTVLVTGQAIKITTDGEADSITSNKDFAGVVIVPEGKNGKVTVRTPFSCVVIGKAKNAITAGQLIKEIGADTLTNKKPTYDVAAAGEFAIGRALNSAAQNANVKVGIFMSPEHNGAANAGTVADPSAIAATYADLAAARTSVNTLRTEVLALFTALRAAGAIN